MTFDEFSDKLREVKAEFAQKHGREMVTVAELEAHLAQKKLPRKGRGGLKSLKGFNL